MKINMVNNTNTFTGRCRTLAELAQKAEKRLQKRLTNYKNLMYDMNTQTIYNFSTGKKFTGKFGIKTDFLEQFFHIKDGQLYATFVRGTDGTKKVGGFGIGRMRLWANDPSPAEKRLLAELSDKKDFAYESMMHNFGIKKCKENKTSTFIGSRGY